MEKPLALRPLSIQDENSAIHHKKAAADGKSKSSKLVARKAGVALESRKALTDITNKSSIHLEASSQKKNSQDKKCNIAEDGYLHQQVIEGEALLKKKSSTNEKLNIAEEGFLHDHNKCIEAQKAALELDFWDTVLPGHDSADQIMKQAKSDPDIDSKTCHRILEELSMSEFSDWFKSWWKSPPSSPIHWDSPPLSPFAWDLESVELLLKEDDSGDV
ncbi:protein PATRONUS 2 [Sesamum indicum]|uniref:Protein PATRONUS 2 n=1 Tax=Sesamum indicum TaxID=4182 RepID=A0A6I9T856_SESIN|nr:protein PATRONUS 2 [Sesamum indicum]XP_020550675.1 protein PATRONUS 2 [Sesamum indicum]XP_020550676.1 protein PATRONUS 2 [Sesamum indicum]